MNKYDSIINLPHYEPKNHPRMSMASRSFEFAPFSALSGFKEEIIEKGRETSKKKVLSETRKEEINLKLQYLKENINNHPECVITYFQKDTKKNGGIYLSEKGFIEKIDMYKKTIMFNDKIIPINDIYQIDILNNYIEDY